MTTIHNVLGLVTATFLALAPLKQAVGAPVSFLNIVSIASSSEATDYWPAANLIQGPGVGFDTNSPYQRIGTLADGTSEWVTAQAGPDYFANAIAPVLTIDLGANQLLTEISVWGYLNWTDNGASAFSLRFATDADGIAGFGTSIAYNPPFGGLVNDSYIRQSFSFSPVSARYVEMTITDNFFGATVGGDRVGLGEIAFQATPVPEPGTMVLAGLALSGMLLARARRPKSRFSRVAPSGTPRTA